MRAYSQQVTVFQYVLRLFQNCITSSDDATTMARNWVALVLICVVLSGDFLSASASPPAKIVTGVVSNVVSALVKWLWSLKSTTKTGTAVSGRSMVKFEGDYTVDTVFDGSKLGIEPHTVEVSPSGDLLVLDSENSNIYKISTPLSRYSRPKLIAGSPEGLLWACGWEPREARMNHPKGLTVDDRGNIYIADTMNMVIRKISDAGVTTIAGGKWGRGGGHVDGPSEDAKFSSDFDVVYIGSSCSLLVIDRGNQAIREIQLHYDDCTDRYDGSFHLGIAMLIAAAFFGYMLALLQRRVQAMFSSDEDRRTPMKRDAPMALYPRPPKSVRPPLIPPEDEPEKLDDGFFGSLGKIAIQQQYHQANKHSNAWPMQESFVIPDEDEPPSIETRSPTPKKTYPFMTKDLEKSQHLKQSQAYYNSWDGEYHQQQQHQMQMQMQMQQQQQHQMQMQQQEQHQMQMQQQQQQHRQQQHHRQYSSSPKTFYEKSSETNEIVFGQFKNRMDDVKPW
ncbi:NHL domain-containing protein [Prunus dulcis]|uniref:NHL domain-containing protein n=1 Tax=Prunus dulcis TaxID=3755 RepID=A0A4Y1R8W7_PRUDU|nr:NHL domain-containing protein [Prunus dulcis]